jgi:nucleoside-diphosphate-sugar epimerase
MNTLILGCGVIGQAVGEALAARGDQVIGVRRRPYPHPGGSFTVVSGDIADPTLYDALGSAMPRVDAVLLAANPGVRRGRDNGLAAAAELVHERFPACRFVYTGTTSVYADAGGAGVDEQGVVDTADPATAALLAVEAAVLRHPDALVLRATALVGPTRTHALERLREAAARGAPCTVAGDLERPFSYLHEQDLAELCVVAIAGGFGRGVLNAAAPEHLSVRRYYQALARRAGVDCVLVSEPGVVPSRWIDASRLQAFVRGRAWRGVDDR